MKNNRWILFSVAAALFWGVWGVLSKLIAENVNPYTNHVLFTVGMLFTLPFVGRRLRTERRVARVSVGGYWREPSLCWVMWRFFRPFRWVDWRLSLFR